mgnify:CR=1 FL=1
MAATAHAPARRRLDPDARRREILRAASRAFATRPYETVQLAEVASAAGASRALVNHYFGDKRGLYLAVARAIAERTPKAVRLDLDVDVEEMVARNTEAFLDLVEASPYAARTFLGAGPFGDDPEIEALQDTLRDRLVERILVNHLGTTEIPPAALLAMRAATGLMERAASDWVRGKGTTREQVHAIVAEGILAFVRHVLPAVLAAGDGDEGRAAGGG